MKRTFEELKRAVNETEFLDMPEEERDFYIGELEWILIDL